MPKRVDSGELRVPLNCLIAPATKTAITGLQNDTGESQGEIVDRAIALLVFGEEVERPNARVVVYDNSADVDSPMADGVMAILDTAKIKRVDSSKTLRPLVTLDVGGKATVETWRSGRKPLLKPSEGKRRDT